MLQCCKKKKKKKKKKKNIFDTVNTGDGVTLPHNHWGWGYNVTLPHSRDNFPSNIIRNKAPPLARRSAPIAPMILKADKFLILTLGPCQVSCGSWEKVIYFQGSGKQALTFGDLGSRGNGQLGKQHSFREQAVKRPTG